MVTTVISPFCLSISRIMPEPLYVFLTVTPETRSINDERTATPDNSDLFTDFCMEDGVDGKDLNIYDIYAAVKAETANDDLTFDEFLREYLKVGAELFAVGVAYCVHGFAQIRFLVRAPFCRFAELGTFNLFAPLNQLPRSLFRQG